MERSHHQDADNTGRHLRTLNCTTVFGYQTDHHVERQSFRPMISVLHVIDTGGPGGAETVFLNCATRLDPTRFTCTAVINDDAWLAQQLRAHGHEPRIESARGSFNLSYLRRIAQIAREGRANLICAHLYGSAVYASSLSVVSSIPLVSVFHGEADIAPEDRFTFLKAAMIRKGSNRVAQFRNTVSAPPGPPVSITWSTEIIGRND